MFDFSYFLGKRYFDNDESQNYLVFQFIFKSSTTPTGSDRPF